MNPKNTTSLSRHTHESRYSPARRESMRSSWSRRVPVIVLSLAGFAIALTLTLFQVGVLDSVWDPFFGDGSRQVLRSSVSEALPIPDASLGAVAYLIEAILESIGGPNRWREHPWIVAAAGLVAAGLGLAALGLIAAQALLVGAFCTLCLCSAAISLIVACLVAPEALAAVSTLKARHSSKHRSTAAHSDRHTSKRPVWHTADQPGDPAARIKDEFLDALADKSADEPPGHPGDELQDVPDQVNQRHKPTDADLSGHASGPSLPGHLRRPRKPADPSRSRTPDGDPEHEI
jgi:uncharacterized membrane protein